MPAQFGCGMVGACRGRHEFVGAPRGKEMRPKLDGHLPRHAPRVTCQKPAPEAWAGRNMLALGSALDKPRRACAKTRRKTLRKRHNLETTRLPRQHCNTASSDTRAQANIARGSVG